MKILITGAGGMLGTDLVSRLSNKHSLVGGGRRAASHLSLPFHPIDLAQGKTAIDWIQSEKPEIILHAAAMTDVDGCETNRPAALASNFEAAKYVTEGANRIGALVIYFGTDFVFDGSQSTPYREEDPPHPVSVYGETKLLGERYVRLSAKRFLILRTAWLFGKQGNNFVQKILKQAEQGVEIRVVQDQVGSPTFTWDLAGAVSEMIEALAGGAREKENQIYHLTNEGEVSRYEFARSILERRGFSRKLLIPVMSDSVRRPARRPRYSVLSTEKVRRVYGIRLRPWQEALDVYLQRNLASLHQ